VFESIYETANSGFAQALYEEYLRDPSSVPAAWRSFFESGHPGEPPVPGTTPEINGEGPAPAEHEASETTELPPGLEPIRGGALRLLRNMEESLGIPTATSFRDIDVSTLWSHRSHFNRQLKPRDLKLSFTHLIGWAIVQAARQFPSMVHAVVERDGTPHRFDPGSVNLGLAVDVERRDGSRGLMVPVIRDADGLGFEAFHAEYERMVAGARAGKLLPDAYQGATITLTNPGTIGTVASVPRLMAGQGSIIATGAIRSVAGVRLMTVTSTYDHRIIQGAESGRFLQTVDGLLQGEGGFYQTVAEALKLTLPETPPPTAADRDRVSRKAGDVSTDMLYHVAAAMSLVRAHRTHGYLAARLDPLGREPVGDPALDPDPLGLTPEILQALPADIFRIYVPGETLADALPRLRDTYCGTIAYEIEHIARHEERVWLRRVIESGEHRKPLRPEERVHLLETLVKVEGLEAFLHRAYLGHKRFGIEGLDMLVPMLQLVVETAAGRSAEEVVIGMAHRGRLNVLTHLLGLPYETLLAEFEGGREVEETLTPKGGTGDVKYHHGAQGEYRTSDDTTITVTLMPNPSHLEAVDPAVEGYARAVQTTRKPGEARPNPNACLPILIHGDAAFAGQGVVAETLNLAALAGYGTGGTLHIITNNQIGFTTDPKEARSTDFASDLAKGFDVPIIHVNADDPDACIAAVRLALQYREHYGNDCVIDLVGYRRHGHNEGDEPRYTQPELYRLIDAHPSVLHLYAERLVAQGILSAERVEQEQERQQARLVEIQQRLREEVEAGDAGEEPRRTGHFAALLEPETVVARDELQELNTRLLAVPDDFHINAKLKRQLDRRTKAFGDEEGPIDWAHAEALAFASLLVEGCPIRFTGQDSERGTFSQRHLVLHDAETGARYTPLEHLPRATASFELHNSPLSEYAVLGFEYGYSVRAPTTLVLWEAQFGDFANGAEIIIDQFIAAGLAKWGQTSRLTMLLPHGYEGQGPEHSSARLERYLAIAAEDNIRVANCSTPAQYFHLLRRQALHPERRPLVLMTPKSLLRLPQASSAVGDLTDGGFAPVLDDPTRVAPPETVTRLVLCSGKIYYDLTMDPARPDATAVAIGRIEMLYPFPTDELRSLLAGYPNLSEIVWVQEEPSNFGARKWMVPQVAALAPQGVKVRFISRPERSSPAEGYPAAHRVEQHRIVTAALSG